MTGRTLPAPATRDGLSLAGLTGTVGVAGSYALVGPSRAFVAVPVHSAVVDYAPAVVVQFAIVALGELGDYAALVLALAATTLLFAGVASVGLAVADRRDVLSGVAAVYGLSWAVATGLARAPWASLGVTLPMVATLAVAARFGRSGDPRVDDTRRFVLRTVGAAGAGAVGYVLGNRTPLGTPPPLSAVGVSDRAAIRRRLRGADAASLDLSGVPGLVSAIDEFYEVDVDAVNPDVDRESWTLSVTGAVGTETILDFAALTGRDPVHEFKTLRCVGEGLNGDKMDTALWTGVPAARILAAAGPRDDATHVVLRAVDGYDEVVPLDAMRDGLLSYGMNGRLLPRSHGAPVRALLPGRWGEVNVKWLSAIDVVAGDPTGYWERRGWRGTGPVTTVATLHAIERLDDGRVRVGGHAYAGTRGVSRVEVSVDGGSTWQEATLSAPLDAADVWRMWALTYDPPDGAHAVVVRAVDGTGAVQTRTNTAAFPSGATGWVTRVVRP